MKWSLTMSGFSPNTRTLVHCPPPPLVLKSAHAGPVLISSKVNQWGNFKSRLAVSSKLQGLPVAGKTVRLLLKMEHGLECRRVILVLGAGLVCRPAVQFLATKGDEISRSWLGDGSEESGTIHVIVASLYLKDAEEAVDNIPNTTAMQLDATNHEDLSAYLSHPQAEVVVSFLPPSFEAAVAELCVQHKKHLVTANYVDSSMSCLDIGAKSAGVAILCEMGLDPGIDHMLAMKMIHAARSRNGKIRAFSSYCGGLPSPSAVNNPLSYKFSWNPAGAIRGGLIPATYKSSGKIVHVEGNKIFDSAVKIEIPDHSNLALEYFPNDDSLVYEDLYGIAEETHSVLRATLRYEGYSNTMGSLLKLGFFNTDVHPMLKDEQRPTFGAFLNELLNIKSNSSTRVSTFLDPLGNNEVVEKWIFMGHCKDRVGALKTVDTIKFLGLHEDRKIPQTCASAIDILSLCMEEKLIYSGDEKDMVLMHHEVEAEFPDGHFEKHQATLLELGRIENGKRINAMALTVGVPAAIGALLLLDNKIGRRGVMRPLDPDIYIPALRIIEESGIKVSEKVETY